MAVQVETVIAGAADGGVGEPQATGNDIAHNQLAASLSNGVPVARNSSAADETAPATADSPLVAGIIYPPPDIRNIVDKTANFVARNGPTFEERIREKERNNPRFCFLNEQDPYHAYYQHKIEEVKQGKGGAGAVPGAAGGEDQKGFGKKTDAEKQPEKPKRYVPPEPVPFQFTADLPGISAQDLDVMKLTAQFVARNGRQFITTLAQREARNYQFDFLRPNHSLFGYFMKLVDYYSKILVPDKQLLARLERDKANKYKVLQRIMQRVEYARYMAEEKKKLEEKQDAERAAYNAIDWHDFVVVETVEFTESDDALDLPPPMSVMELQTMTLAQKRMAALSAAVTIPDAPEEMEDDSTVGPAVPAPEPCPTAPAPPPAPQWKPETVPAALKIRTDYVPKVLTGKTGAPGEPMEVCPRCNQSFPVSEMAEHMRIELLDPKWKEQKEANEAKKKESNLLREGTDVAKNLAGFSAFRSDIFGSSDEVEIGKKINEDAERAKVAEKQKVIWDGHTASIGRTAQQAAKGGWVPPSEDAAAGYKKGDNIGPQFPQQQQLPPQSLPPPPPPMGYAQAYSPTQPMGYHPRYPPVIPAVAGPPPPPGGLPPPPPGVRPVTPGQPPYARPLAVSGGAFPGTPAPVLTPGMGNVTTPSAAAATPISTLPAGGPSAPVPRPTPAVPPPPAPSLTRPAPADATPAPEPKRTKWGTLVEPLPETPEPTFTLHIKIPSMPEKKDWKLTGETVSLTDITAKTLVKEVKNRLEARLGMPAGKQKLVSVATNTALKNQETVSAYGLADGGQLVLEFKAK